MNVETTIRLALSECREPVRLTLANGNIIVIVIEDDLPRLPAPAKARRLLVELDAEQPKRRIKRAANGLECCGKPWKSKAALGIHKARIHGVPGVSKNRETQRVRLRDWRKRNGKPAEAPESKRTRGWNPNKPLANGGKEYRCRPCDLLFDTLESLNSHQVDEHGVRQLNG